MTSKDIEKLEEMLEKVMNCQKTLQGDDPRMDCMKDMLKVLKDKDGEFVKHNIKSLTEGLVTPLVKSPPQLYK